MIKLFKSLPILIRNPFKSSFKITKLIEKNENLNICKVIKNNFKITPEMETITINCKKIDVSRISEYLEKRVYNDKYDQIEKILDLCTDKKDFEILKRNKILENYIPYNSFGNTLEEYKIISKVTKFKNLDVLKYLVEERKINLDYVAKYGVSGDYNLITEFYGLCEKPEYHQEVIAYLVMQGIDLTIGYSAPLISTIPLFKYTGVDNLNLLKYVRENYPEKWKSYLKFYDTNRDYAFSKKDEDAKEIEIKYKNKGFMLKEINGTFYFVYRTKDLLSSAICQNNIELVKILLEDGMNPNEKIYDYDRNSNMRGTETTYLYKSIEYN